MAVATRQTRRPRTGNRALSPDQARAIFDREARRIVQMSGEEFLRRYDDDPGQFQGDPERTEIVELEMLIPLVR